jgi:ribosome-binding protein aMBF1 (putative translation factor)
MKYHKYNNKINIVGELIAKERMKQGISYQELSNKLQLIGVCLYKNDLFLIEKDKRMVRDFELIAIIKTLKIDIKNINIIIENFENI